MAELSETLGTVTQEFRGNIAAALQLVQSDISVFLAFAGEGGFSNPSPPSLPNQTDGLNAALKTYLVSTALTGNGYQVALAINANDQADEARCDLSSGFSICDEGHQCPYYNEAGFCMPGGVQGDDWHSNNTNARYELAKYNSYKTNVPIITDIISKNYTTGARLFDDAATCNGLWNPTTKAWASGLKDMTYYPPPTTGGVFNIDSTAYDFSCLTQMKVLVQDADSK